MPLISKSETAENNSSTKLLDCLVANTFLPFNNLNSFNPRYSTLRSGFTVYPVKSSILLETSVNMSLENDSNSVN